VALDRSAKYDSARTQWQRSVLDSVDVDLERPVVGRCRVCRRVVTVAPNL